LILDSAEEAPLLCAAALQRNHPVDCAEEVVNLTLAIIIINVWNRLAITFRSAPGERQPGRK